MLPEVKVASEADAAGVSLLRQAAVEGDLGDTNNGLGQFSVRVGALRKATSMNIGLFAWRRALEFAQLVMKDVPVIQDKGVVDIRVVRQKGDQLSVG